MEREKDIQSLVESFISSRISNGYFAGSQALVSWRGEKIADLSDGYMSRDKVGDPAEKVGPDTIFNIESITKTMVTLPLVFRLIESGRLCLEHKVAYYLPKFGCDEVKKAVTVRDMLNFKAGIPMDDPPGSEEAAVAGDMERAWDLHYSQPLAWPPASKVYYSDVSCRILGKMIEKIMDKDLACAAEEIIFKPLGMEHTMFVPGDKRQCVSTGVSDRGRILKGELTQDLEHYLGGVLGSDGLFSNARDMCVFSEMLLNGGVYAGRRILGEKTVKKMIGKMTNPEVCEKPSSYLHYILSGPKVWLWEYADSPYSFFGDLVSEKAIGKMGGAGTFLLIDPQYDLIIVYLTNYGQPERTLAGDEAWDKFQREINMMGLCDLVIGNLPV